MSPTRSFTSNARLVAAVALATALAGCGDPPGNSAPNVDEVPEIAVITLQPQRLALTTELPGRVAAAISAEVRPQVSGVVQKRLFTEGGDVKPGELLYQIDPATYQASVASAEAALARAEATFASARLKAARQRELAQIQAVSRQDSEDAEAALQQAKADVASAQAALQTQRINLAYTRVTAPVGGRIGRSSVTPGALVTANQASVMATIQQLDPIYVDVTQSSSALLALRRSLGAGIVKSSTAQVKLLLEDGTSYDEPGTLEFAETSVDVSTGSVTLRVRIPNPRGELLPGMYARAVVEQGVVEDALLVPQRAVSRDGAGQALVSLVDGDGKLVRQIVKAERAVGDQWLITAGLKPGDRVAVEGHQKVAPGGTVRAVPAAAAKSVAQR